MNNPINHPSHYNAGKIEVISAIEDWKLGFNLGNVVKYVARADYKENALVDLEKAAWYLSREIERRKGTWEDPANKINPDEFEAERKKRYPKNHAELSAELSRIAREVACMTDFEVSRFNIDRDQLVSLRQKAVIAKAKSDGWFD